MEPLFKVQPEVPPLLLAAVVFGLIIWVVPPALHLGPLGKIVTGFCALALAAALARRAAAGQAQRRAAAGTKAH